MLHGGMDPAERSRASRALDDGALTLLATDAAAEGLNLHHRCRIVIHYELPWNPSRLEQRAGRVDRIGQARRVHEIALVAASTAERLVIAPLTIRASRARPDSGRNRLLGVLTESRVAEMVMGGSLGSMPDLPEHIEASESRFRIEAVEEAVRLQHARMLIGRSGALPKARPRSAAPFVSRTPRAGLRSSILAAMADSMALLYSITIEAATVRAIHEEIAVFVIPAATGNTPLSCAAVRSLVASYVSPVGSIGRALETSARRALERVESDESRRRQQLDDRRRAIDGQQRSAARTLVQLGLFRRRSRTEASVDTVATSRPIADRIPLQVHTKLVSALLIAGARGTAR
jgi:hypothetical protein